MKYYLYITTIYILYTVTLLCTNRNIYFPHLFVVADGTVEFIHYGVDGFSETSTPEFVTLKIK